MRAGEKLYDNNGREVALFPLEAFVITQTDQETYSHQPNVYWATDYMGWSSNGRVYRAPCYAPVDIKLIWQDRSQPVAVWESLAPVHLANGVIDYLTITCYHDNDVANGVYNVGDIKRMGDIFNKTGTGGNVGDHLHLETGRGRYTSSNNTGVGTANYKYHITDYTAPKRLHNYEALFINDTTPYTTSLYPATYPWVTFQGGSPTPPSEAKRYKFKWVLYANKIRNR